MMTYSSTQGPATQNARSPTAWQERKVLIPTQKQALMQNPIKRRSLPPLRLVQWGGWTVSMFLLSSLRCASAGVIQILSLAHTHRAPSRNVRHALAVWWPAQAPVDHPTAILRTSIDHPTEKITYRHLQTTQHKNYRQNKTTQCEYQSFQHICRPPTSVLQAQQTTEHRYQSFLSVSVCLSLLCLLQNYEFYLQCESKKLGPFHLSITLANTVRFY